MHQPLHNPTRFTFLASLLVITAALHATEVAERYRIQLSPFVTKLLNDSTLSESERRRLSIFHGQWPDAGLTVSDRAQIALYRYDLSNPLLTDAQVTPLLRATAALYRGDPGVTIELLANDKSAQGAVVMAQARWQLGQISEAIAVLSPWRQQLASRSIDDPLELVAAARALTMLAQYEGRPSQDYQLAMRLFSKVHQEIDRLCWPANLAEAALLVDKDNARDGRTAVLEALALNPRAGQGWYLLGLINLQNFAFEQVEKTVEQLRQINPLHLLADLLEAHMFLWQHDPTRAEIVLQPMLQRYPNHREGLALLAAAKALAFDDAGLATTLQQFDDLSGRSPLAHFYVGKHLALIKQYDASQRHLQEAIERFANWPQPQIELGLLLMQSGNEQASFEVLRQAARLDPFNRRAHNQLKLVEELLDYEQIHTDHFTIKFRKGEDEALARDMPKPLEQIYNDVTSVFNHEPEQRTIIEIMPDEQRLGVRVIGMPEIWTIAACTGRIIAIVTPREGPKQRGTFDWENVIRHEFVHTVTLDLTNNRIPHWLTEACAVSQENRGRDYATYQLLAEALHHKKLFDLDQIKWAFVRPKTPQDRPLAYAQSHWMHQYIVETYGHETVLHMLDRYRAGATNIAVIEEITEETASRFMEQFSVWAQQQVATWGLVNATSKVQQLPEKHPDRLRALAEKQLEGTDYQTARHAIGRYAAARPVDPWSQRALARLALRHGHGEDAVGPLEQLDRVELHSADWARELAKIHRSAGRLNHAAAAMRRALYRAPYNTGYRELAATIDLQRHQPESALHQIHAMTVLEPNRPIQWMRLAAVLKMLGQTDRAKQATAKAQALDTDAPAARPLE